jgi:ElaB/YqjD/DUF883 family membrane-anchored ribosome-binding protein
MSETRKTAASRDKLLQDFNQVVADTEDLLRSIAAAGGDKASALRSKVEDSLQSTKERLGELQEAAMERGTAAARATDDYVHENPWQAIGIAAAVGVLVGLLISRDR